MLGLSYLNELLVVAAFTCAALQSLCIAGGSGEDLPFTELMLRI